MIWGKAIVAAMGTARRSCREKAMTAQAIAVAMIVTGSPASAISPKARPICVAERRSVARNANGTNAMAVVRLENDHAEKAIPPSTHIHAAKGEPGSAARATQ